jgi:hypothetical protein
LLKLSIGSSFEKNPKTMELMEYFSRKERFGITLNVGDKKHFIDAFATIEPGYVEVECRFAETGSKLMYVEGEQNDFDYDWTVKIPHLYMHLKDRIGHVAEAKFKLRNTKPFEKFSEEELDDVIINGLSVALIIDRNLLGKKEEISNINKNFPTEYPPIFDNYNEVMQYASNDEKGRWIYTIAKTYKHQGKILYTEIDDNKLKADILLP